MVDVVVCGGGVVGLASALLLARDGHRVTVLEQDADPPPDAAAAWEAWPRRGVAQFRQPHNLFARFQHVLEADLPDVQQALRDAGCTWRDPVAAMPSSMTDRARRAGDERFGFLTGRRPVVEAVFAATAAAEPGVQVVRGVRTTGLLLDADQVPLRVRGVRTDDGEDHPADLVVDAMGRTSPVAQWLTAAGARPAVSGHDRGFAYYSVFLRGEQPVLKAPGLSPLGSVSLLTIPGDGDTWSVTVFGLSRDRELKQVRDPACFQRVVAACPRHAHWLDGEPLTGVLPMAGVLDRHRRYVEDGRACAVGLVAVGDAWACTNPSAGRGLSVGLVHAQLLRDVLRERAPADASGVPVDEELALQWDARTEEVVGPWYTGQQRADAARIAEMAALREGAEPPPPDPVMAGLTTASATDPDAFRGLLDLVLCLAHPPEVLARPAVAAAVAAAGPPLSLPGPDRRELVALLAG